MSDYIVPPKKQVVWKTRIYGAGERVPGYTPPAEIKKPVPKEVPAAVESLVEEVPVPAETTHPRRKQSRNLRS